MPRIKREEAEVLEARFQADPTLALSVVVDEKELEGSQVYQTSCAECYMACGCLVYVKDGRALKVDGDPADPLYKGKLCIKGYRALESINFPDRVIYPMKNEGGAWKRVTWDKALDGIVDKSIDIMEKYGPKSLVGAVDGPATLRGLTSLFLVRSLGSPNIIGTTDVCEGPAVTADMATVGVHITNFSYGPDCENSDCILLWGANPPISHPPHWDFMIQAKKRGAKLIVVDPRVIMPARRADLHLRLRPGSDGALALGMMNLIIREELYDKDFVRDWCHGFEELKKRVEEYPVDRVARITELPAEDIVKAARMYATTKPACVYTRLGTTQKTNGTQNNRAISCLIAITGNVDVKGGNLLQKGYEGMISRGVFRFGKEYRLPPKMEDEAIGRDEFPLWTGPQSIYGLSHYPSVIKAMVTGEPYPVKALFTFGNNVALTGGNSPVCWMALESLELLVCVDFRMTPTGRLSHYFLPSTTWLERDEIVGDFYGHHIMPRQKAVEPPGECRNDMDIVCDLLERFSKRGVKLHDIVRWKSNAEFNEYRLAKTGLTFEDLKKRGVIPFPSVKYRVYEENGFNTPTGKAELYSTLFEKYGYDPLPGYQELDEGVEVTEEYVKKYPLTLVSGGRERMFFHTGNRDVAWARKLQPWPEVEIHPKTAAERNIKDGDKIHLSTRHGRIKAVAAVSDRAYPDMVQTTHGWWLPESEGPEHSLFEITAGMLTQLRPCDRETGNSLFRGLHCQVERAEA